MIGITLRGAVGMGDQLQFTSFPENYFRNTGSKVIDLDHRWIFDHNPFVIRGREPTQVLNLWAQSWPELSGRISSQEFLAKPIFFSIADRTASMFRHVAYLRHPRLYEHEALPTIH